jgi:hypothetical protein
MYFPQKIVKYSIARQGRNSVSTPFRSLFYFYFHGVCGFVFFENDMAKKQRVFVCNSACHV